MEAAVVVVVGCHRRLRCPSLAAAVGCCCGGGRHCSGQVRWWWVAVAAGCGILHWLPCHGHVAVFVAWPLSDKVADHLLTN